MSLATRKAQAKKEIEEGNRIPDGEYGVRLIDWECTKSRKNLDMYKLDWKIKENGAQKGKQFSTYYSLSANFAVEKLLDLLEEAGADLNAYGDDLAEINKIFEEIEDAKMPTATVVVTTKEGKPHPDKNIKDVERVLNLEKTDKSTKKADAEEDEVEMPY